MGENFERLVGDYLQALWDAAMDDHIRLALSRAVESFRRNRAAAFKLYPWVEEKAERLREVKDYSLLHVDELAREVKDRVEDLHGNCIIAETVEEAMEYIGDQVKPGDVVVKAKSITSEELHLNPRLEELGCKVYETDLGEFIIQNLGSRPMHILSPAIHVSRERVAELFSKVMGREFPPDIPTLAGAAREFLREKFLEAKVGISGANAIAAETGTTFLIGNEGNTRLVTGLPEKHIVIAGLEKIVPTLQDGMLVVEVVSRYANYKAPAYVSLISGPSKTGDIEKQIVYGAHGPREYHVVLLDNHRREMIKDPVYRQALRCLRCGACLYECTIYPLVAGYYGYLYMGGIGAVFTKYLIGGMENAAPIAYTCTLCGRCKEYCPMKIDVPEMILKLRSELAERGLVPERVRGNVEEITGRKLE
ncbi:lactate utilization protein [Candidatus Bathyarchaeota archaeon]|nr:MAG: lactate utilization protein [Candidatus Bathyarchaeota archaeon]